MKILWITNIIFPEALAQITSNSELKASGGWMLGAAKSLCKIPDNKLFLATVSGIVSEITCIEGENYTHFIIPSKSTNFETAWQQIHNKIQPDVVHIHGTEFAKNLGLAYINACGNEKAVVSIQGLLSSYHSYYLHGISPKNLRKHTTFYDFLSKNTLTRAQKDFKKRASYEIDLLRKTSHIIGRTPWDKSLTWAINPNASYHFCNETLREEFYSGETWNYNACSPQSIFLSQAIYPIKGLHQLLEAMPLIIQHFPQTKIRVAGPDITKANWNKIPFGRFLKYLFKNVPRFYLKTYGYYILKLIKKYNLENRIIFTGQLNANQMKQEYLRANVFVCPSAIENSPNSLCEAQVLGTPVVASYVGGVDVLMSGNEENMYRFEETQMLANKICTIFAAQNNQKNMRQQALNRHNPETNTAQLMKIYAQISQQN